MGSSSTKEWRYIPGLWSSLAPTASALRTDLGMFVGERREVGVFGEEMGDVLYI